MSDPLDVLIIGAGLSGVAVAYHLQTRCPGTRYEILEGRDAFGGTWDLFRYPGVRSDSDMYTFGYAFRPWTDGRAFAPGADIQRYVRETAEAFGIDRRVRFGHRVVRAEWSSEEALWTVDAEVDGERVQRKARFLYACTGYYDYERGHAPTWPDQDRFEGEVVHPQFWPEDLDYSGKRIVVIGSGATAVTLVPALAETAAHVTMLQRSPTYVAAQPSRDLVANALRRLLPERLAHGLARAKNVAKSLFFYQLARRKPGLFKRGLLKKAQAALGPSVDVRPHFDPAYDPWDERLCLAPDGDLFETLQSGDASIVTDHVEAFTETGIRLESGDELEADLVITATGLKVKLTAGLDLFVDGQRVDYAEHMAYKGTMYSDVPNLFAAFGYTNASWTLKVELSARWACRLLRYMDRRGYAVVTPQRDLDQEVAPVLDFTSGYVQRALQELPSQGTARPWRLHQNYLLDLLDFRYSRIDDGALTFEKR